MKLKTPVVVHELGNVMFFPSIDAAQFEFEPPDVRDDAYEFFSAAGRRMRLRAVGPRVVLEFAEDHATAAAQLRTLVTTALAERGVDERWLASADLDTLVARGIELIGA